VVKNPSQAELVAEMQAIVRMAAEPRQPVDGLKVALNRASRALGLSYRRTMSFWYGHTERVRVSPEELARLRAERRRLLLLRMVRLEQELAALRRQIDDEESARLARRTTHQTGQVAPLTERVA
jgi:hypothetical protein